MIFIEACNKLISNISKVIVGNKIAIELVLVALLAEGHVLLEDVPGIGKTVLAKALSKSIGGDFKRVQCTPDLLPTDITGFNIFNRKTNDFELKQGPVMTNILLVDEINRAVPRTQSSLLESMEERQVTVDANSYKLPDPFFVIATQNPIEFTGTFPLPEAQLDRFLLILDMGYPTKEQEIEILNRFEKQHPLITINSVVSKEQIIELQKECNNIQISDLIKEYISDITQATRHHSSIAFGVSPRGTISLMKASKALAMLKNRNYVLPDDVKYLIQPVLSHRIVLTTDERLRGKKPEDILDDIIKSIKIPIAIE